MLNSGQFIFGYRIHAFDDTYTDTHTHTQALTLQYAAFKTLILKHIKYI